MKIFILIVLLAVVAVPAAAQKDSSVTDPIGRLMFCHDYFMNKNKLREKIDRDLACADFMAGQGIEILQDYIAINCESIVEELKNFTGSNIGKEEIV